MTMTTEFDRLLGSVLADDGPQGLPPGLVEAALGEARTTDQRRPWLRVLDPLAWPPLVGPMPRLAGRRLATLAALALLVIAALAVAVLVGSPRPPRVLGDGQRAFVWMGETAYQFIADGSTEHHVTPGRGAGSCPTLVGGTSVIARFGFNGWDLIDVSTDTVVGHITFNTAGREGWTSDGRRMAIMDTAGRLGMATVDDPAAPELVWFAVPGIVAFDWSASGDRLAILSDSASGLTLEIMDVATGARRVAAQADGSAGDMRWSSDGSTMLLHTVSDPSTVTLLDVDTGRSVQLTGMTGASGSGIGVGWESAWTNDGTALALVRTPTEVLITDAQGSTLGVVATTVPARDLAWSASGDRLAFREGDVLVVVDRDGTRRRAVSVASNAAFQWDGATTDLIVAIAGDDGVAVERYETTSLTPIARLARPPAPVSPTFPSSRGFVDEDAVAICLELDASGPVPPGDP